MTNVDDVFAEGGSDANDEGVSRFRCALPHARYAELAVDGPDDRLRVAYYETPEGEGRPIVLVHPLYVAAGTHDVRPLFEYLARAGKRVYALDLPGFGRSDRGDRLYDDAFYARTLARFLIDVVHASREGGASVVAMSLSCEIAARVAIESPSLVSSLVFLSPTGLSDRRRPSRRLARVRHGALSVPPVGRALFAFLTTHVSLRFHLARSLSVPVPEALMEDLERTVRAPSAERAPLAVIAGLPFHPRPFEELYRPLRKPIAVVYDADPSTTFERLPELVRSNPCVHPIRLPPSGGLSTYEHPATLAALVVQQQLDVDVVTSPAAPSFSPQPTRHHRAA